MTKSYFGKLYSFQDEVLPVINNANTDVYLTGGTTASRAYLNHRFSEDLDLFVNDDDRFSTWAERVIHALEQRAAWMVGVLLKEERFVRCTLASTEVSLRIEMVNGVPAHVGNVVEHSTLGRIDSPENLANKITALIDRQEPKTWPTYGDSARKWNCLLALLSKTLRAKLPAFSLPISPEFLARRLTKIGISYDGSTRPP